MTANEAAEQLRGFLEFKGYARHASLIEEALAAQHRATVERIRERLEEAYGPLADVMKKADAILAEEASREAAGS